MKPRRLAFAGAELEEPLKQVHFIKLLAPPKLLSKGAHRQLRCGFARLLEVAWSVGGISLNCFETTFDQCFNSRFKQ